MATVYVSRDRNGNNMYVVYLEKPTKDILNVWVNRKDLKKMKKVIWPVTIRSFCLSEEVALKIGLKLKPGEGPVAHRIIIKKEKTKTLTKLNR